MRASPAMPQIITHSVAVTRVQGPGIDLSTAGRLHGAGCVSQVFKLACLYAHQRTLRLADGPDEVHRDQVGRLEIAKYN
jgi:acyl-CoA dehydrogenase